jgi:hypothetical protein
LLVAALTAPSAAAPSFRRDDGAAAAPPRIPDAVRVAREMSRGEIGDIQLAWAGAHRERPDGPAIDALMRAAVDALSCT